MIASAEFGHFRLYAATEIVNGKVEVRGYLDDLESGERRIIASAAELEAAVAELSRSGPIGQANWNTLANLTSRVRNVLG